MKKHLGLITLASLVVVLLLVYTVAFQVDQLKDIVLVKTFGRVTAVYRGDQDPGLHFKWPWPIQRVVRYDARTHIIEDPFQEITTKDGLMVLVSMYCTWRIEDPEKFQRAVKTVEAATERLRSQLSSDKSIVIGQHAMGDLVNADPSKMLLKEIEGDVIAPLKRKASADYGVEVRMVGVKLIGLPTTITTAVIEAQKADRKKEADRFREAGNAEALAIRERAKMARKQILAFAGRKAKDIRTEGDRAAAKVYTKFAKHERLSMYLRFLESLRKNLRENTVMVLDGSAIEAIRWFRDGPSLPEARAPGSAAPAAPKKAPAGPAKKP